MIIIVELIITNELFVLQNRVIILFSSTETLFYSYTSAVHSPWAIWSILSQQQNRIPRLAQAHENATRLINEPFLGQKAFQVFSNNKREHCHSACIIHLALGSMTSHGSTLSPQQQRDNVDSAVLISQIYMKNMSFDVIWDTASCI